MANLDKVEIFLVKCHPRDPLIETDVTFGISASVGGSTRVIEDISDDYLAMEAFRRRLSKVDFDLSVLPELVDDFLTGRYGM